MPSPVMTGEISLNPERFSDNREIEYGDASCAEIPVSDRKENKVNINMVVALLIFIRNILDWQHSLYT
jgi:hypothetical protein